MDGADGSSSNPATGLVNIFRNQDTASASTPILAPTPPVVAKGSCPGTGGLWREQWDNVSGTTVASIPLTRPASSAALLPQAELLTSAVTNYGARLRGYICPPVSGTYVFQLCADDAAELWLSSGADPTRKQRLAACQDWTNGPHDFTRYPAQQSAPLTLQAGQQYYVEVLHKQGWGPGYLSLAWLRPDGLRQEPIPGSALIPFAPSTAATTNNARGIPNVTAPSMTQQLDTDGLAHGQCLVRLPEPLQPSRLPYSSAQ
ncbi:MAG: PA14 domain-containing protein [Hymenobacter sp.]